MKRFLATLQITLCAACCSASVPSFTMGYIGLAFGLAASLALGSFSAILTEVAKQLQQTGMSGLKP